MREDVTLDLEWQGDLRFGVAAGETRVVLDGGREAGLTPVQALCAGLAGCMAIDLVHILGKQRQPLRGLTARLVAERAESEPRCLRRVELQFVVRGDVEPEKVERALSLSREKYCSVWHSIRQDVELLTSYAIERG